MADNNPSKSDSTRRTVIKGIGTSVAALTTASGAVSARRGRRKSNLDKIFQTSKRVLHETGSVEKQHEFLKQHDFTTARDSHTFTMETGGVTVQDLEPSDLDADMSLFTPYQKDDVYYAQLSWDYAVGFDGVYDVFEGDGGAAPMDIAALAYDKSWWDYEDYDLDNSTRVSHPDHMGYRDGTSGSGPAFNVNDQDAIPGDLPDRFSVDVRLKPVGPWEPDMRRVQGAYTHTSLGGSVDGVSVSFPAGVSVSTSFQTQTWTTDTEKDGETLLRVNQADPGV